MCCAKGALRSFWVSIRNILRIENQKQVATKQWSQVAVSQFIDAACFTFLIVSFILAFAALICSPAKPASRSIHFPLLVSPAVLHSFFGPLDKFTRSPNRIGVENGLLAASMSRKGFVKENCHFV
jgi:hypothetical protein